MGVDTQAGQQSAFDYLYTNQNHDGGWGFKLKSQSYTEPTAMALLALLSPVGAGDVDNKVRTERVQAVKTGLDWLRSGWHEDGGWGIFPDDQFSNWGTYLGAWVFSVILKNPTLAKRFAQTGDDIKLSKAHDFISSKMREPVVSQDQQIEVKKLLNINSSYLGFSWGPSEAGWVITTSLAMIARAIYFSDTNKIAADEIITNAKEYLIDRSCPVGGWNVGNPYVFDKQLPPTPDATSYALLAWSACSTAADFNQISTVNGGVSQLDTFVQNSRSAQTIALGVWALRLWEDASNLYELLLVGDGSDGKPHIDGQDKFGGWNNSPYITALAALALSDSMYYFKPANP